jgi:hypothetical protein
MIFGLAIADIFQASGPLMSIMWLRQPVEQSAYCKTQGNNPPFLFKISAFLINFGDTSSVFWVGGLCFFTNYFSISQKIKSKKTSYKRFMIFCTLVCFGIPLLLSFIGLFLEKLPQTIYGPAGYW